MVNREYVERSFCFLFWKEVVFPSALITGERLALLQREKNFFQKFLQILLKVFLSFCPNNWRAPCFIAAGEKFSKVFVDSFESFCPSALITGESFVLLQRT